MTYGMLQNIISGILSGDNVLPADAEVKQGLIYYALTAVAMQAESLHLMTLSTANGVLRLSSGDYLIRVPEKPPLITINSKTDIDKDATVDIDEDLMFAVARYVASYLSKTKGGIHVNAADRIIKDYNAKTYEILEQMAVEAQIQGTDVYPACDAEASTEFIPACPTEFTI